MVHFQIPILQLTHKIRSTCTLTTKLINILHQYENYKKDDGGKSDIPFSKSMVSVQLASLLILRVDDNPCIHLIIYSKDLRFRMGNVELMRYIEYCSR